LTEDDFKLLYQRTHGVKPLVSPGAVKPQKYHSKWVIVDGRRFQSMLEARWFGTLSTGARLGMITEPLLQVRFSLGVHYGRERVYIADFVYIDLHTACLVVADAKGYKTTIYKQKKLVFEALYGISITEFPDTRTRRQSWTKRKNIHKAK
jgi:hypothetical protein